ncbi:MAG: NusA N-terminal domain-containing protein, partial [Planctomycetota bacterium]
MNPADMIRLLDSIAQDRNIDRNLLLQDLEEAMKSAARKHFNSLDVEEFGCRVDPMTGEITMWRNVYDDIDDPEAMVRPEPIALEDLGRIPAQTA